MKRSLDRNITLQKDLERSCKSLEKELKIAQRKTQNVAEACVSFTYRLLQEAAIREKENVRRRPKTSGQRGHEVKTAHYPEIEKRTVHVRPQTAHNGRINQKEGQKRPSSAHPLIPTNNYSSDVDSPESETPHALFKATNCSKKMPVNKSVLTASKNDMKTEGVNNREELRGELTSRLSEVSIASPLTNGRHKSADFYRRKHPECEMALFWNRRVNTLIAKWDKQDLEPGLNGNGNVEVPQITDSLTPPLKKSPLTEAEKKIKAFVRRFGQKYRIQIGPGSSTSPATHDGGKNFTISGRELASIHAETSRRLKNTQDLLKKSEKLQQVVERYSGCQ